jgi:tRNA(Ile)-lysidine synthase
MTSEVIGIVRRAARKLLEREPRIVLAVSGGADSMALLDAVANERGSAHHVVAAIFDHGTGEAATAAAALAAREAILRRIAVRTGGTHGGDASEAAWREARWRFLRRTAAAERATIATAHTRDDHIETVVMRILRGSGTRGLAGLLADSDVRRPLLGCSRSVVRRYSTELGVLFVEDPSNLSRAFLRNRVRLDLIPAITRARPGFDAEIHELSRRAAKLRRSLDGVAERFVVSREGHAPAIDVSSLNALTDEGLRAILPSVASHLGIVLDRRGIIRLAHFTRHGNVGSSVQLSGGHEIVRHRETMRPGRLTAPPSSTGPILPLDGEVRFGAFHFRPLPLATIREVADDPWCAALPKSGNLVVRSWKPGDRMLAAGGSEPRRIKRFFADKAMVGPLRRGWPVVLLDGEIVWIPGVRRGAAITALRENASIVYRCEPISG